MCVPVMGRGERGKKYTMILDAPKRKLIFLCVYSPIVICKYFPYLLCYVTTCETEG